MASHHTQNCHLYPPIDAPSSPGSSIFDLPVQSHYFEKQADQPPQSYQHDSTSFIVISGGTGCNSLCSAFGKNTCYVLPVSDDGGSSSEIIRVIGGPSVGDIRSRLIRLIPPSHSDCPLLAIRNLLAHRLQGGGTDHAAREEWRSIIEGKSFLWKGIPLDRKEAIRGFLIHFEGLVLKRAHKNFSFRNGSIGNYLLAAAQDFFRSLPSAIFLFASITSSQANILPVIVTNHIVTIAAELEDSSTITGQCNISHPIASPSVAITTSSTFDVDALDANQLVQPHNALFSKHTEIEEELPILPSRISKLYYINTYGNEIHPYPNPEFLINLACRDILVYSCGSLWTSLMPCLALRGVGDSIANSPSLKAKALLLNAYNDRETNGYLAVDYIRAIVRTLQRQGDSNDVERTYPPSAYITHLIYLREARVSVNVEMIKSMGIRCVEVTSEDPEQFKFSAVTVRTALQKIIQEVSVKPEREHESNPTHSM